MIALLLACVGPEPGVEEPEAPALQPLTAQAYTALQATWAPLVPPPETAQAIDEGSLNVTDLDRFADAGLGVVEVAGQPWEERDELAPGFSEGLDRRSIAWFWQAADSQLIDEESPIRFEAFTGLYRPQGHLTTQAFVAHVDTAARLSALAGRPFEFALLAGDLTDGSQLNELQWAIQALNGGVIDPDSGVDDDPVPGPGNDYNDPFLAGGLPVPWYAALGNHESQYNGGFGLWTEELATASVGNQVYSSGLFPNGYRDGSTLTAEVVTSGSLPADPDRRVLNLADVLGVLANAGGEPAGHGLDASLAAEGIGYFSVRPSAAPVRLIVLNTVNTYGGLLQGEGGVLDREQFTWLEQELTLADADRELIVVMSHHRSDELLGSSEVSGDELIGALAASDGVILHITGHGHHNDSEARQDTERSDFGYWELMLASTVDFPMHTRCFEIVDERNGYVSVYATNVDHNSPEGSLPHEARRLAAAKRAFGTVLSAPDVQEFWDEDRMHQNLLLRLEISAELQQSLASYDAPARIESLATLATLTAP